MKRLRSFASIVTVLAVAGVAGAQFQLTPVSDQSGHVGLGLELRKLNTVGIFMHTTAHPDDENNALLAMLAHGEGYRTVLASATRGEGGQNEIGPELFDALSILRSEELLAAHRFDGAEQLFTRAVDFGYSFSLEETLEKWDREEILRDFVFHIRSVRPDVIVALPPSTTGGGLHHQASARLTMEAFHAAADPARFPDQLAAGLRAWQPKKLYTMSWRGFPGAGPPPASDDLLVVGTDRYDPLLGRTYDEIGSEARSMHKCQGMPQVLSLPGGFAPRYRLADTVLPPAASAETSMFDGVDASIMGLAQHVDGPAPTVLTRALSELADHAARALERFESGGATATVPALLRGLETVRALRADVGTMGLDEAAAFEIDFRLDAKERQFQRALVLAHGLRLEALADDGLVTRGQTVGIRALVANRGPEAVAIEAATVEGLDGVVLAQCADREVVPGDVASCAAEAALPEAADLTAAYWSRHQSAARYVFEDDAPFGAPFRPTPFVVTFDLDIGGTDVTVTRPIEHRYQREIFTGEKRTELVVVPRFAVRVSPDIAIIPATSGVTTSSAEREVRVTVTHHGRGAADGRVGLVLPDGWAATPDGAPVAFTREDEERTVRFAIRPAVGTAVGDYPVRAFVEDAGRRYDAGYQVIEYPHTRRRHLAVEPEAAIKVVAVDLASDLTVGYVMGVGDAVPQAIRQLGATVELLGADQLAWGDLGRFDVIVTGVRAYERRDDLRAHNGRLLEYVRDGGTMIVQYNKFEFNDAQYGPYPAEVGRGRVTDEHAPVEVLRPEHPVFRTPNVIGPETWRGWVQERGLYFLGDRDERYVDLVQLEDSFENNTGIKRGALVEARFGRGRWIYVGLGLWRQLPAGTRGAYPLLANLLSLGKTPPTSSVQ